MTDNTNIIKEALEAGLQTLKEDLGILSTRLAEEAPALSIRLDKINAALALIEKSEVMWSGTSEEGVTSYYPQDFAAEYIERTTGVKMTKVLVIPLQQEQEK